MIQWKKEYELGIEFIDEQHQRLFEIGNRIFELMDNDFYIDKYDRIIEIVEELKDYTVFHFKAEEEYMLRIGYKKILSHKVEHDDFIRKFDDIDFENIDHRQDHYVMELMEFIFKWIKEHILVKDKSYIQQ